MSPATATERLSTIVPPEDAGGVQPMYGQDETLIAALRRGDDTAFSDVVARHSPAMLSLARSLVREQAAAEEAVQETWAALLAGLWRFQGRSSLKTWLFRILYKRCLTKRDQERRSIPFSVLDGGNDAQDFESSIPDPRTAGPADPGDPLLAQELRQQIAGALESLPPSQRRVMELRDLEGRSSVEVCAALRVSECNQRVLLHRARLKVRAALEGYLGSTTYIGRCA